MHFCIEICVNYYYCFADARLEGTHFYYYYYQYTYLSAKTEFNIQNDYLHDDSTQLIKYAADDCIFLRESFNDQTAGDLGDPYKKLYTDCNAYYYNINRSSCSRYKNRRFLFVRLSFFFSHPIST